MLKDIVIKGANENNLKNIDLTIPRNKLVVFTGVSGSGKSTLAFDTIFAEGQRRYMESLSSYARQFLGQMNKPNVEHIDGLSPSIAIDQKTTSNNPRSTVGTVTEIYDYLRLLYAHTGTPYCPNCKTEITHLTVDSIIDNIKNLGESTKIQVVAYLYKGKKGSFKAEFEDLRKQGFARVIVDNEIKTLDEDIVLDKNFKHTIGVVVDRIVLKENIDKRLTESVELALKLTNGTVNIIFDDKDIVFNTNHSCATCGFSLAELTPRMFSFNSPFGACDNCTGLGFKQIIDPEKIVKAPKVSLLEGAISVSGWTFDSRMARMFYKTVADHFNVDVNLPYEKLPKEMKQMILYGTGGEKISAYLPWLKKDGMVAFEGIIPNLERRYHETNSEFIKSEISKFIVEKECEVCAGKRLKKEILNIKVGSKNIAELCDMSVGNIKSFFSKLKLSKSKTTIAEPILKEINSRLDFLINVGLEYLTLSRSAGTLSGGESQRIRLATQIGSSLTGVIYILDEPSIGLHQRDNDKLLSTLQNLRDIGNTVIVVEHDEDTMRAADYIVDIGPLAGVHGGEVVATGSVKDIINCKRSITGRFLSKEEEILVPSSRRIPKEQWLKIYGAKQNNLKNINVEIPTGVITVVTGVSGSGKSSLVNEIIYPAIHNKINRSELPEGKYSKIENIEIFDKVINIDQSPIGRTPRSNPATYTGVFNDIRDLFASTTGAKERGYTSGRFSFNVSGGRCENCGGAGINKIEMYFLPDVYVSCDECKGKRYNRETLEVKYKNKSIFDVLDMTILEANDFFENIPKIKNKLQTLVDVGLGYIKLGQPATELSGGEAQRVKLATELCKKSTGKSLYILDEPTTGLHLYDVKKLIKILDRLVSNGNTILIIEHNLDVIKCADYIIDMGYEGGENGGEVIAYGTPEEIVKNNIGYTAKYLKNYLK